MAPTPIYTLPRRSGVIAPPKTHVNWGFWGGDAGEGPLTIRILGSLNVPPPKRLADPISLKKTKKSFTRLRPAVVEIIGAQHLTAYHNWRSGPMSESLRSFLRDTSSRFFLSLRAEYRRTSLVDLFPESRFLLGAKVGPLPSQNENRGTWSFSDTVVFCFSNGTKSK
jgi:hypothetical protein